jgi:hypothetical protein
MKGRHVAARKHEQCHLGLEIEIVRIFRRVGGKQQQASDDGDAEGDPSIGQHFAHQNGHGTVARG